MKILKISDVHCTKSYLRRAKNVLKGVHKRAEIVEIRLATTLAINGWSKILILLNFLEVLRNNPSSISTRK